MANPFAIFGAGMQGFGQMEESSYAASGVSMEGSALDVLEFSAANAELDALTIRYESEMEARSYRKEADLERMRLKSLKKRQKFDMLSTAFNFGSAGIG